MKIDVNNIEELINNSNNPELFNKLYKFVSNCMGEEGSFFKSEGGQCMIGYKYIDYKEGKWPVVCIAPQKNNISIYIFAFEGDKYLVEKYAKEFGKSNIGRSCIRIKKMTLKREEALKSILEMI